MSDIERRVVDLRADLIASATAKRRDVWLRRYYHALRTCREEYVNEGNTAGQHAVARALDQTADGIVACGYPDPRPV